MEMIPYFDFKYPEWCFQVIILQAQTYNQLFLHDSRHLWRLIKIICIQSRMIFLKNFLGVCSIHQIASPNLKSIVSTWFQTFVKINQISRWYLQVTRLQAQTYNQWFIHDSRTFVKISQDYHLWKLSLTLTSNIQYDVFKSPDYITKPTINCFNMIPDICEA